MWNWNYWSLVATELFRRVHQGHKINGRSERRELTARRQDESTGTVLALLYVLLAQLEALGVRFRLKRGWVDIAANDVVRAKRPNLVG